MGRIVKVKDLKKQPARLSAESREAAEVLISAHRRADELLKRSKDEVIDLALHLAEKIVGRAVETDPSYLDSIYSRALGAARDLERATVYINPEDRAASKIDQSAKDLGFEIVEDEAMKRAGCRIKSGDMEVSVTIEDALHAFETAMKGPPSV